MRAPLQGEAARRAVARVAAVQRAATGARGDAGLAQLGDVALLAERLLERAQLGVDGRQGGDLAADELDVLAAELVLVEDEAAEVAVAELADAPQEAQAAAEATAVAEARLGRRGRVFGLGSRRDGGLGLGRLHLGPGRRVLGALRTVRAPARRSWQQALHMERAPSLGASDREYSGAPDTSIHASSTRRAMRSADHSAARARPSTRGSGAARCAASDPAPRVEVVRRAERPRDAVEGDRVIADGGGEDGHVARERLEDGQAEALVVGRHDDGVRGVDPVGDLERLNPAEGEQLRPGWRGELSRAVRALRGPGGIGGEQEVTALAVEPEPLAGLGARHRTKRSRSTPHGSTATRRRPPAPGTS